MKQRKSSKAMQLFLTFLKIGAFTFGGGYAMIPMIEKEVCDKKSWLNKEDILKIVAVAESTPGPIAINAATFVGYQTAGFFGDFMATFGVVLPSFLIITILSFVIQEFQQNKIVQYVFFGIRAGVLALILKALISMFKTSKKGVFAYTVMIGALLLTALCKINAVFVIMGCAAAGIAYTFAANRGK